MQRPEKSSDGRLPGGSFASRTRAAVVVVAATAAAGVVALLGWIAPLGIGSDTDTGGVPAGDDSTESSGGDGPHELPTSTYPDVGGNVRATDWLIDAWESDPSGGYPAFRMFCEFSHLAYADPIIAPGDDQFMHLHMFFGNTSADETSTYESLRSSGGSTCDGGPLNRTAYWMPAVFDGNDEVVVPDRFELYYKGENAADPSQVQAKPNGLRMIAGYPYPEGPGMVWGWRCDEGPDSAVMPDCAPGQRLTGWVRFPYCWDGENLDSPDHRSHMAYGRDNTWGPCPESHPVHLPELTEFVHFDDAGGSGEWYLSSDRMDPADPAPNGSTFHADWFGAWDNSIQDRWTNNCIRAARNSSNGNLCDGEQLRPVSGDEGPSRITDWHPAPGDESAGSRLDHR